MTRSELAAVLVRMLQEEPQSHHELCASFDEDPSEIRAVLGWLAGQGVVQNMGGSWRICPGSVPKGEYSIPDTAEAPRVAQAEPSEPTESEPPEPDDMAKTKVCNTCEERKPLSAYTVNRATSDGHANRCKACDVVYRNSRKNDDKKAGAAQSQLNQITRAFEAKISAKVDAAIAEEPAPLLHAPPVYEVPNKLEIFPAPGFVVIAQTSAFDGIAERHALLVPRSELRSLIDQLTRQI